MLAFHSFVPVIKQTDATFWKDEDVTISEAHVPSSLSRLEKLFQVDRAVACDSTVVVSDQIHLLIISVRISRHSEKEVKKGCRLVRGEGDGIGSYGVVISVHDCDGDGGAISRRFWLRTTERDMYYDED